MRKPIPLLVAALALLLLVPVAFPHLKFVITLAVAKGFAALGVALLLRGGLISLGHAMYFAIGAYATAFLGSKAGVSDLVLLLVASTAVAALAGLVFGAFLVRYRAIFFAMLNLAVSMVIFALTSKLYGITGGTDGLRVAVPTVLGWAPGKAAFDGFLFYLCILLMVVLGWLVHRYLQSPLGHALSAIHTNEVRLEYLGVSAWQTLLTSYTISAALAGLGGALAAMSIGHVLPEFAFWTESGHLVLTAVLGGIGGVAGAFIGSVFLEILHTVAVGVAAEAWNLIIGLALIGVIFFLPRGIYGLIEARRGSTKETGL
ncbi:MULTISPECIES: branched-chain amino acid ABC transporter permease [Paracoccus]|uniref:Amino acid/amide ABC transporter membrane protein 2 (HAAT family) n=1 Tax=Paracoccus versutus TaxID=34007 RepID=A0A369TTR7_PARVE|nr:MULTISPECIES: branched-chain amino acid ABC transporter permease [Paracoccus]SFY35425.1 ABC-type branched-chain amino acid transport system, permease component [Paracoccus pantotrophus]MBT0781260.1 branched-chain amino acid ABC transporter permease [Paracoccus sp. pheM1]RDD68633.1 branched-chain amino acid ABC transporter permease [Paracoccus versutus]REF73053.1 amino acid/amide ABC transporter membrane protein 2 (HAAT family) [Paracoccus versutus]WGR55033.1 branched-chain amino acid ABC tr